ncbi:hypothetical protein BHE74_00052677 [Ensete ventricosum]|nr:hypothetical protein BHE74_00052677 [Ensete ventricosum]
MVGMASSFLVLDDPYSMEEGRSKNGTVSMMSLRRRKRSTGFTSMHARYVPVMVGTGKELQRFVVSVKAFEHPCFVSLLEMAAQEFGYRQKGVLRIPCDAQHFEQVLKMTAK